MKLNFVERAIINSRARAFAQRRYEAPLLERIVDDSSQMRGMMRQSLPSLESVVYVKRGGKWLQALYTEIPAAQ